ncbi:MAG: hypothetical protein JWM47_1264 [Acidimicrobiales bacterium]|nr:hypothetical protein [Acidimicrobiales bacterium]
MAWVLGGRVVLAIVVLACLPNLVGNIVDITAR